MPRPYQYLDLDQEGIVTCVRFRRRQIDEPGIHTLGNELASLIEEEGCRSLVVSLGPEMIDCLYSVFLAKLVMVQRRIQEHKGALILSDVSPDVMGVFAACKLTSYFEFAPDRATAVERLLQRSQNP